MTLRAVARAFDPSRLKLARHASGLLQKELAERVGVTPAAISQYESGLSRPGASVLAKLALALGVEVEYFRQHRPVSDTLGSFRSLRSTSQRERNRASANAHHCRDLALTLEQHIRLPELKLPRVHFEDRPTPEQIEAAAASVRSAWELPAAPIGNVVASMEASGVVVTRLLIGTERVSAFSVSYPDRPVVVLGGHLQKRDRSRFDAAHELGHLVMHSEQQPGDGVLEQEAHRFAAAFLMPSELIADHLPRRIDWNRLFELKRTWGVSLQALLYRARELDVVSESAYRRAMIHLSSTWGRTDEPVDLGLPESPMMLRRALALCAQLGLTISDIARAARLTETLVAELAGETDERPRLQLDPTVQ